MENALGGSVQAVSRLLVYSVQSASVRSSVLGVALKESWAAPDKGKKKEAEEGIQHTRLEFEY